MEITEHQADLFRALADGKRMQVIDKKKNCNFEIATLDNFMLFISECERYEVRIKPDVIIVNGIEVPAPVKQELTKDTKYWIAIASDEEGCSTCFQWGGGETDSRWLSYGIVHLSRYAAAAHGKAMRAHKPG